MMSDGELTEPDRGPNVTVTQHVSVTQQILRAESELAPDYQMVTYWPYENTGNGRWNQNIGFLPGYVFPDSIVFANICELTALGGSPFVGAATMRINNIAPGYNLVVVQIEIDWNWPLPYRIQFQVAPPIPTL
jgi:hypothetical protein